MAGVAEALLYGSGIGPVKLLFKNPDCRHRAKFGSARTIAINLRDFCLPHECVWDLIGDTRPKSKKYRREHRRCTQCLSPPPSALNDGVIAVATMNFPSDSRWFQRFLKKNLNAARPSEYPSVSRLCLPAHANDVKSRNEGKIVVS